MLGAVMALSTAARAQGTKVEACSLLTATQIEQISKRTNQFKLAPSASDPTEVPKGVTECHYLGFDFSLTSGGMTRDWFESTRKQQEKSGVSTEPVSGLGDEAYFWERKGQGESLVGIAFRVGPNRLVMQDMTPPDSVKFVKPVLLELAKTAAPKLR
jgi:hypothetical protein